MFLAEVSRLDMEILNECLQDVPTPDNASDTANGLLYSLRNFWSTKLYIDHAWKGMDDNEAWAA